MYIAVIAVMVVMGDASTASADPVALVKELGASRFAQREAAKLALSRLGRPAVPALQAAEASPDPELRNRASEILRKIEEDLLISPTLINLNCSDQPLAALIAGINSQANLNFKLAPDLLHAGTDRRVTIQSPGALPYWQALDELCAAGQLHHVFGGRGDYEQSDSAIALYDGMATQQGIFADHGPFRIQLASLQYQSEVHLSRSVSQPGLHRQAEELVRTTTQPAQPLKQFFCQILVGAEPRLAVAPSGGIKLIEAIDDQGRSLAMPSLGEVVQHESGYLGVNPSPLVHLRLDLTYPDGPATRLKRLSGTIPLLVSTRKPDPLEIPLDKATTQPVRHHGTTISVGEVCLNPPDQAPTIELAIRTTPAQWHATGDDDQDAGVRQVASPQQLEVLDAAGRSIPWFPANSFYNGEEVRLTLALLDRGGPIAPTTIRYHSVIRKRVEVPFEFRDLPMP